MTAARRVGCRLGPVRAARALQAARRGVSGTLVELGRGWTAEVAFGRLIVGRGETAPMPVSRSVRGTEGQLEWGRWRLRWRQESAPTKQERAALTAWFAPGALVIRPWVAGERIRPLQGRGGRLLVRCFQDARVPRSQRTAWPVVAGPDGLVWVPGVCRSDALLPSAGTEAMRIDAEHA
jgi:tRNA(Ile)-lysidine synthetase-like protein